VGGSGVTVPSSGSTQLNATPAPIDLPELNASARFSTASDRGKYAVVNFWASTCAACAAETPALESENESLGGRVAFVGIDVADKTYAGRGFAKKFGVTYPLLTDPDGKTAGAFALSGLPYTVILSPKGKVLVRHPGAFTQEQLDYLLRSLDTKLPAGS
jgi:thiol-disulfide isomerase/thioredoxin